MANNHKPTMEKKMSIESNLKSIAESLKTMAEIQAEYLKVISNRAATAEPITVTEDLPKTPDDNKNKAKTVKPADQDQLPPVTMEELKAFNGWLNEMVAFLGETGGPRVLEVLKKHGVSTLPEIGDDRAKLNAIRADVEALGQ